MKNTAESKAVRIERERGKRLLLAIQELAQYIQQEQQKTPEMFGTPAQVELAFDTSFSVLRVFSSASRLVEEKTAAKREERVKARGSKARK